MSRPGRARSRRRWWVGPLALGLLATACGGSPGNDQTPTDGVSCAPNGTTPSETAKDITFEQVCLATPAGIAFQIAFDNRDEGIPHNIQIFSDPGFTRSVFQGDLLTGVAQTTYQVPKLAPGRYRFRCDIHPEQMQGILVVV